MSQMIYVCLLGVVEAYSLVHRDVYQGVGEETKMDEGEGIAGEHGSGFSGLRETLVYGDGFKVPWAGP